MRTNVLLVDGRKVTREGLSALLEKHADIRVVGDADEGAVAAKLVSALGAHVVVMLVGNMTPQVAERIKSLTSKAVGARVVVMLLHLDANVLRQALEAGAAACLSKECASQDLVAAIRAVRAGKTYLSPTATSEVVNCYVLG